MIEIRGVQTTNGKRTDLFVEAPQKIVIDARHLMLFPALVDPHVHFRTPGEEDKENWESGSRAALSGGVTTVFDMPNNIPPCTTEKALREKMAEIDHTLQKMRSPLRYYLYFGADPTHLQEIPLASPKVIGLKIYMGGSTGSLLVHTQEALEEAFRKASEAQLLVTVHAEDEELMRLNQLRFAQETHPSVHSKIRDPLVAARAVERAIALARKYRTRLYIAHVSTQEELSLIQAAKKEGLPIFAEATPHHLFLSDALYATLGTRALVNPPLRKEEEVEALWEALHNETIDVIGTDHAPHLLKDKELPYGQAPSGFPSIELYFPLLLTAYHAGKISLEEIVSLTHTRAQEIFQLPLNEDLVLVDLSQQRIVDPRRLHSKAGWSPYAGMKLQGWPRYLIAKGQFFDLERDLS